MASGVEIGRLSVKVSPDTSQFRRELKSDLKALKKALDDGDQDLFGAEESEEKVELAARRIGKKRFRLNADTSDIDKEIKRLNKGLSEPQVLDIDADVSRMQKKLGLLNLGFERRTRTALDHIVDPETVRRMEKQFDRFDLGFEKKVENFRDTLRKERFDLNPEFLKSQFTTEGDRNELQRLQREMFHTHVVANDSIKRMDKAFDDAESRMSKRDFSSGMRDSINNVFSKGKKFKVNIDVDIDRNRFSRSLDRITDTAIGGLGKLKNLMPSFGSGINPAGYVAILAAVALVAAPLIGVLSAAILSIPGLIAAVATPFAAIALGLEGIKKAAGESGLINITEDGVELGQNLKDIQKSVSDAFAEGLKQPLTDLNNAIPALLKNMPMVAQGLSAMAKGFTDAFTSDRGAAFFDETIRNISTAMAAASPGVRSFTDGMLQLTTQFTRQLPAVSDWFNRTGESFSKWVEEMSQVDEATGKTGFDQIFKGLGDTLTTIGDFIVDLGKQGLEFVQDPQKMQDFIQTLKNVGKALENLVAIGNKLGPVWDVLADLGIIDKAPEAKTDPFGNPVKDTSGGKGGGGGDVVDAIDTQTEKQQQQHTEDKGFWGTIKQWAENVKNWTTSEQPVGAGGRQIVGPDGQAVYSMEELAKSIEERTKVVKDEIANLETAIEARTTGGFKQSSDDALNRYKEDLATLKAELAELQTQANAAQSNVGLASVSTDLNAAKEAIIEAQKGSWFEGVDIEPVKVPPPDTAEFTNAIDQLPIVVGAAGDDAAGKAGEIPPKIGGALEGLGGIGSTAGAALGQGLLSGMQSMEGPILAYAGTLAGKIAEKKGPIDYDKKVLEPNGQALMFGLAKGMENGFTPVLEQAKGMADQIAAAFASGTEDPTTMLAGFSKAELDRIEKVLNLEMKRLDGRARALTYEAKRTGNDALKAEAERLRMQKDELSLQKEMLGLATDYNDEVGSSASGGDPLTNAVSGLMNAPVDFAKATGQQFLSDLGISGDGFISRAITEGIQYVFQIGSVDEALSIKDREESKNAMSMMGR